MKLNGPSIENVVKHFSNKTFWAAQLMFGLVELGGFVSRDKGKLILHCLRFI